MNWKINYWTVLFVLLLAGVGYNSYIAKPNPITPDGPPINLCVGISDCATKDSDFHIPVDTATNRISRYAEAMTVVEAALIRCGEPRPVENFVLNYVKLPRCEMYEMLCEIPDGDVYVFPTIEYDEMTNEALFSIILGDAPYVPGKTISGVEKFFDFGKPCPNACPKKE